MYRIGELAKQSGLSTHALRYYEKEGLLQASNRTDSGYREYSDSYLQQILFIAQGKNAGFSLDEIRHLMAIRLDKQGHTCQEVTEITQQKLSQVKQKITELNVIKQGLEKMLDICCGGNEAATECSILSLLEPVKVKEQNADDCN